MVSRGLVWCGEEDLQMIRRKAELSPDAPPDARDGEAHLLLVYIDDLLVDNTFRKARPTLEGIRNTVEQTGWVTRGQREAVRNIVREFTRVH